MGPKLIMTYLLTVLSSIRILNLSIQGQLVQVVVVLITGLIVVILQWILETVKKYISDSTLRDDQKRKLMDMIDKVGEDTKNDIIELLKGENENDERDGKKDIRADEPDNQNAGTGTGTEGKDGRVEK